MFDYIPGKWISSGEESIEEAILFAEKRIQKDLYGNRDSDITLHEFARDIFTEKDPYGIRKRDAKHGREYSEAYYRQKQSFLEHYILKRFGAQTIGSIIDVAIEDWLLDLTLLDGSEMAADTRNKILTTFRLVLQEARRQGIVRENEADKVQMVIVRNEAREPFTKKELEAMFPKDDSEMEKLWGSVFWAAYFLIMRDTGFRPGEVAALRIDSYTPELHGVFSRSSVDYKTRSVKAAIKTTFSGKDYKIGILTAQTERFLARRISECRKKGEEYLFLIDGRNIEPSTSNKHFKASIFLLVPLRGRTQYCLRHSFETDLAGEVEDKVLAELMAHTRFNPAYDHRTPERLMKQLQPVRELLEKRFS